MQPLTLDIEASSHYAFPIVYYEIEMLAFCLISSTSRCYYVGKNMAATTFVVYLLPEAHCLLFLQKRPNMIKIELLISLAYFGIVRTLSTETAKTAHFVFFLLLMYNSRTIAAIDLEKASLDHEYVLLHKRSLFETFFVTPLSAHAPPLLYPAS